LTPKSIGASGLPPIKVLILFTAAALGGAERSLSRMALFNGENNIIYKLGTLGGSGAWSEWMETLGRKALLSDALAGSFVRIGSLVSFVKAVRSFAPHFLYVIGVRGATLVRLLSPALGPVKIVHGIRTTFGRGSSLTQKFFFAERALRGFTAAYVANSDAGARSLIEVFRIPAQKVHIIRNGIEVPADVLNFTGPRPKVVVVVANMLPIKGHREFIEVVEMVRNVHRDVSFQFVGRDEMGGEIARLAYSRGLGEVVKFAGFQANIWPWLTSAQIFSLPSRETEGMPTAVLEAMGAGLPVVAFSVGGISNVIRNGIDGQLVEFLDSRSMARAIVALLDDPARASQMGSQARARVLSEFSLRRCADDHALLWRELLARSAHT
jgi:glycosyltransferase involved in cell wall biosynthesis